MPLSKTLLTAYQHDAEAMITFTLLPENQISAD